MVGSHYRFSIESPLDKYRLTMTFQLLFYVIALLRHLGVKLRLGNMIYYYTITILAQLVGAYRQATGKAKPFWEKAESTRT